MLIDVLAVVDGEGWFDSRRAHEKTIYLSQGSAQGLLLSRGGRPDTFVKFTQLMSLAAEAERTRLAGERFAGQAPEFVGYASRAPLEIVVTRAVDFRPLTERMAAAGKDGAAVGAGLERFFARMQRSAPASAVAGHAWFDGLRRYFAAQPLAPAARDGVRRLEDALPLLPALAQHGDLVLNNLGLRPDRELVVFDWEDYGALALPGLDLFTLEHSLHQLPAAPGGAAPALPGFHLTRLCRALGIDRALYESLRLGYALAFRYLKRNYNAEVRARLDAVIDHLAGQAAR